MRKKRGKFQERYILGIGFPWAIGSEPYHHTSLADKPHGVNFIPISFPKELWSQKVPKYRLVLEKVKEV